MTDQLFSRRMFLAGLTASTALPAQAFDGASAVRPRFRSGPVNGRDAAQVEQLIADAKLNGTVTYAVCDAKTGELLETRSHLKAMPPASVTKAITALYALEHLGPGYRYKTRLLANGPINDGRLEGDLFLEASGDPVLTSDDLGDMAEAAKAAGIRSCAGDFYVRLAPFANSRQIDTSQPHQVSYNPGVSGLNLNLNRVHFEWVADGDTHDFTMQARDVRYRPDVVTSSMKIIERPAPVFDLVRKDGVDQWSVARGALGKKGARWLPVRDPQSYALGAFAQIMQANGIDLPKPQFTSRLPQGLAIYETVSPPMSDILRRMLKISTNLTAEVVGQTATLASGRKPKTIRGSANAMSEWLRESTSARRPRFVDHSGLGETNDISAADMVAALVHAGPNGALAGLLKPWRFSGNPNSSVKVVAKTGTLNFVSGLAGFVLPPSGRPLAFAIFAADEQRRNTLTREQRERPPGGKSWGRRARTLDDRLISRWTDLYT